MMGEKNTGRARAASSDYSKSLLNATFLLAAVTGVLHFYIGVVTVGLPLGLPLILIGLVYLGGVGLITANYKRDLLLKVGLGWVLIVIVLWALSATVNAPGTRDPLSLVDKALELVLLGLLLRIRMVRNKPVTVH